MLERPPISDERIARCLHSHYGISTRQIVFLPIGYDSSASVFRVEARNGSLYFLKFKRAPVAESVLLVPHFLHQAGIENVIAPLTTHEGQLSAALAEGYTAILYPFLEGRMGAEGGLSPAQWTTLGEILRRIHQAAPPDELRALMRKERFVPLKGELAWTLHREMAENACADPLSRELSAFWQERRDEIEAILLRSEALGKLAQARQKSHCLCHADIHIFNVLVDSADQIYIIDWDETLLAPKERDLMFLLDGTDREAVLHPNEIAFREGYGPVEIDPTILAFYRYEWVVQEIAEFGKQVLDESGGALTREDGLHKFRGLFAPGDVVDGAYRSDI